MQVEGGECGIMAPPWEKRFPLLFHGGSVIADDDDDEVLFISRFRLRPYVGARQGRPGVYLSNYLVDQNNS